MLFIESALAPVFELARQKHMFDFMQAAIPFQDENDE